MRRLNFDTTTTALIAMWGVVSICFLGVLLLLVIYLAPKFIALHQPAQSTTSIETRQVEQATIKDTLEIAIRLLDFKQTETQQPSTLSWQDPLISGSEIGFEIQTNIPLQITVQTNEQTLYQTEVTTNEPTLVPQYNEGALRLDNKPQIEQITLIAIPLTRLNQKEFADFNELTPIIDDQYAKVVTLLDDQAKGYIIKLALKHVAKQN